jgi:hypothetical protein
MPIHRGDPHQLLQLRTTDEERPMAGKEQSRNDNLSLVDSSQMESALLLTVSPSAFYVLGSGNLGVEQWKFFAHRATGEIVYSEVINAPKNECGAVFLYALSDFLASNSGVFREVITEDSEFFCNPTFTTACARRGLLHRMRPPPVKP